MHLPWSCNWRRWSFAGYAGASRRLLVFVRHTTPRSLSSPRTHPDPTDHRQFEEAFLESCAGRTGSPCGVGTADGGSGGGCQHGAVEMVGDPSADRGRLYGWSYIGDGDLTSTAQTLGVRHQRQEAGNGSGVVAVYPLANGMYQLVTGPFLELCGRPPWNNYLSGMNSTTRSRELCRRPPFSSYYSVTTLIDPSPELCGRCPSSSYRSEKRLTSPSSKLCGPGRRCRSGIRSTIPSAELSGPYPFSTSRSDGSSTIPSPKLSGRCPCRRCRSGLTSTSLSLESCGRLFAGAILRTQFQSARHRSYVAALSAAAIVRVILQQWVVWPASMQRLSFGSKLNQPIAGAVWPASLQQLSFRGRFDQPIAGVVWPASLREIHFGVN